MVCLMCGITLKNATAVLGWSGFRVMQTPQGKMLLALVKKEYLEDVDPAKFVLLSRGMTEIEGLHVGVEREAGSCVIVGRTWISKDV